MGNAKRPDNNARMWVEITFERHPETGMWRVEVFANWAIPNGGSCCTFVGGSAPDEYEHATRSEAAAAINGLVEKWLAENA
jgi:hypothetical protein